ncbi:MAG: response regulator [Planctomycetes bacterium]|nr:response regulator [Planctomycetota bacterium]
MTDPSVPAPDSQSLPSPLPIRPEPPVPSSFGRPTDVTRVLRRTVEAPAAGAPRILVVDDAHYLRRILAYHLVKAGYIAVEAENGLEALRQMKAQRCDAVLLDLAMPVMDGFQTCKAMKQDPALRDIPVIICTARNEKASVVQSLTLGADDYVVKPYEKGIILEKLAKYLKRTATRIIRDPTSVERRTSERAQVVLTLTHVKSPESDVPLVFRVPILNLSLDGCCFEFTSCQPCPGYAQGSVDPQCIFYPYAAANQTGVPVELLVTVPEPQNTVLEIRGRIAHVFRPEGNHEKEMVGVRFVDLSEEHKSILRRFISDTKRMRKPAATV